MEGFSKLQWMDAVRQCVSITAERRIVISHIGATADQYGANAWRDNKTVAAEVGVSEDTVSRARKDAIRCGLWIETRPYRGGRGGAGRSAEYRLTMPEKVRSGADHWPERSAGVQEKVRRGAVKGPQGCGKRSAGVRTPSGISSGISSGSSSGAWLGDSTAYPAEGDNLYALQSNEHDPWAAYGRQENEDSG